MMKTKIDETLEEIWAIRRKLAKRFDYDPKKAAAYYRRRQKELGVKLYQPEVVAGADALHDRTQAETAASQCATLSSYRAKRKPKGKRGR